MMIKLARLILRLSGVDRRIVFVLLAALVAVPFFSPPLMRAKPSPTTVQFLGALEEMIASKGPIIFSLNFGPQTVAEMEPIALAVMHKVFSARKKVIFLTFLPEAAAMLREYLGDMEQRYGLVYGRDYVFLGYATTYWMAINNMGTSIKGYFHKDDRDNFVADIPMLQGVDNYGDIAGVVDVASNTMPRHWITYAQAPYKIDFVMATTAVQATDYFPFLQTGQVRGLLAGGRTAAEIETLLLEDGTIEEIGDGTRALGSQSMALWMIIVLIALGNLGYFVERLTLRKQR